MNEKEWKRFSIEKSKCDYWRRHIGLNICYERINNALSELYIYLCLWTFDISFILHLKKKAQESEAYMQCIHCDENCQCFNCIQKEIDCNECNDLEFHRSQLNDKNKVCVNFQSKEKKSLDT